MFNVKQILKDAAADKARKALPVLSFPAAQKLGVNVEELVKSSELQAKAMEIVAHGTDTLASVSLMDLSVEAETFGATVRFSPDEVPTVVGSPLVEDEDDLEKLEVPDAKSGRAGLCVEAIRKAKELVTDKPVLAGIIGPFSLAGRLMDVTEIMYQCYEEPELVHSVLRKATDFLVSYAAAMRDAGADGVVMAEPLAGILGPNMMAEFSKPYVKEIIDALQTDSFAIVYHNCGNAVTKMLDHIFEQGAAGYHFGNAVYMAEVLAKAPADAVCMGNLDPVSQLVQGTPDSVREAVKAMLDKCGGYPNYIISSGCDIPAKAKWENLDAFFEAVRNY